jgi:hypothetical protein
MHRPTTLRAIASSVSNFIFFFLTIP